MISAARHAGLLRPVPVIEEALVDMIAALGRLDVGETRSGGPHRGPVDLALPLGHVDPLDRLRLGPRHTGMESRLRRPGVGVLPGAGMAGSSTRALPLARVDAGTVDLVGRLTIAAVRYEHKTLSDRWMDGSVTVWK